MKTKNKMEPSTVESKEWCDITKEYFTKELEKNLVQHRANEFFLMYKLEAYQKNFPNFIYFNPTSIEVSGQDEETEVGPSGIVQEEEVQTKDP
jgi:hypothetical protein